MSVTPGFALVLALAQGPDSTGQRVAEARLATGTAAAARLTASWSRRLERDGHDRLARLGLATLARWRYAYEEADRHSSLLTASAADEVDRR